MLTYLFCVFYFYEHMTKSLKLLEKPYFLSVIEMVKVKTALSKDGTHPNPHIVVVTYSDCFIN